MTENTHLVVDGELREICKEIPTSLASVATFISAAHLLVWERLSGKGLSDNRLKLIELYLAAHFAAITYPVASFEAAGKVQESLQYKVDKGLEFTKYGQQAMMFDTSGTLRRTKAMSIEWLGLREVAVENSDVNYN